MGIDLFNELTKKTPLWASILILLLLIVFKILISRRKSKYGSENLWELLISRELYFVFSVVVLVFVLFFLIYQKVIYPPKPSDYDKLSIWIADIDGDDLRGTQRNFLLNYYSSLLAQQDHLKDVEIRELKKKIKGASVEKQRINAEKSGEKVNADIVVYGSLFKDAKNESLVRLSMLLIGQTTHLKKEVNLGIVSEMSSKIFNTLAELSNAPIVSANLIQAIGSYSRGKTLHDEKLIQNALDLFKRVVNLDARHIINKADLNIFIGSCFFNIYMENNDSNCLDSTFKYINIAIPQIDTLKNRNYMGEAFTYLAVSHNFYPTNNIENTKENLDKALFFFKKALSYFDQESYEFANTTNLIGQVYFDIAQQVEDFSRTCGPLLDMAILYSNKALAYFNEDKYPIAYAGMNVNLANIHAAYPCNILKTKNEYLEKALHYAQESSRIILEAALDSSYLALSLIAEATIYKQLYDFSIKEGAELDTAIQKYKEALNIAKGRSKRLYLHILYNLSNAYRENVVRFAKDGIQLAHEIRSYINPDDRGWYENYKANLADSYLHLGYPINAKDTLVTIVSTEEKLYFSEYRRWLYLYYQNTFLEFNKANKLLIQNFPDTSNYLLTEHYCESLITTNNLRAAKINLENLLKKSDLPDEIKLMTLILYSINLTLINENTLSLKYFTDAVSFYRSWPDGYLNGFDFNGMKYYLTNTISDKSVVNKLIHILNLFEKRKSKSIVNDLELLIMK